MVPKLFHSPPPSEAAKLSSAVTLVSVALVVPDKCNAPPFPGLGMIVLPRPISTPAALLLSVTPERIKVPPDASSIAPPALLA